MDRHVSPFADAREPVRGRDNGVGLFRRQIGADDRLIEFFNSGRGRVEIVMSSDVDAPNPYLVRLHRIEHDPFGATYWASAGDAPDAPRLSFAVLPVAWLCNVTHDVFGEHPKDIYIHTIE